MSNDHNANIFIYKLEISCLHAEEWHAMNSKLYIWLYFVFHVGANVHRGGKPVSGIKKTFRILKTDIVQITGHIQLDRFLDKLQDIRLFLFVLLQNVYE